MKLPFISRTSHEEMVAELRRELADRKEEARKIMDLFTQRATGLKVFYPDPEPEPREEEDVSGLNYVAQARRKLGPKANPRDVLKYAEQQSTKDFQNSHSTAAAVPFEMDQAMNEGRAAAKVNG